MNMNTTITVDYIPVDDHEIERIELALGRLADAHGLDSAELNVWCSKDRGNGLVMLADYNHKYAHDCLDTLARIISRLFPSCDVRIEEESFYEDYWAHSDTYRAGRKVRTGYKDWIELDLQET